MSRSVIAEPAPAPRTATPAPAAKRLQRSANGNAATRSDVPSSVHATLASPGRALEPTVRSEMENRFGTSFSSVRLHDSPAAAQSANDVGARAYTVGQDIVWGSREASPESPSSRHLLAHELAHTVQQGGLHRSPSVPLQAETSPGYHSLESEAERAADAVASGHQASVSSKALQPTLSRATPTRKAKPTTTNTPPPSDAVTIDTEPSGFQGPLKHQVWYDGPKPKAGAKAPLRVFRVDKFYLPGDKGEGAEEVYKQYASANQLRSVVGLNKEGTPRTELWQSRDAPEDLGESWLQRVNWPVDEKDARWKAITGEAHPFPKVTSAKGPESAQIDHIVELQMGGANNPANLRPLDREQNGKSGGAIWQEVSWLAKKIRSDSTLEVGAADQIELRFNSVETNGNIWPGKPAGKPLNALQIHHKAMEDRTALKADSTTKYIKLGAGANVDDFAVPADWGSKNKTADLTSMPFNKGPNQMISSMKLKTVNWVNASGVSVVADLDLRNRTRIPLSAKDDANKAGGMEFKLSGTLANGFYKLSLPVQPKGLGFNYPFLSPVTIKTLKLTEQGDLDWSGTLKSSVGLLGDLEVSYTGGQLKVTKGIDPATLKAKKVLGFSLNKAEISLLLSPDFKFEAGLGFQVGPDDKPYLKGGITITPKSNGLEGEGTLDFDLPKIKKAQTKLRYSHLDGVEKWDVKLEIQSDQFSLPGGYTLAGKIDVSVESATQKLIFGGQLDLTLPGGTTGKVGLTKNTKGDWFLTGECTFKVPKVEKPITVAATYILGSGILTAKVTTEQEFKLPVAKLTGKIKELNIEISEEGKLRAWGGASVTFEKGKVKGGIDGNLHRTGHFSGTGSLSIKVTDSLTVSATADFDERKKYEEQLAITGEIAIENYKFFDERKGEKKLFSAQATIPIPGLSAGTTGLVINIGGGAKAVWKFGPGLMSLKATAKFNPLENDPDITLDFTGGAKIGASVGVEANIFAEGALQGDAIIAKAGIAAGLEAKGLVDLRGEAKADVKAKYGRPNPGSDPKFNSLVMLSFNAGLFIKVGLDAYVRAYAESIIGWNKSEKWVWKLAEKEFDTGLKFALAAPFKYGTDDGLVLPEAKDVTYGEPALDSEKLIKDRWSPEPSSTEPIS